MLCTTTGVPHRSSTTQVRIYPPSSGARQMTFLIPASMDVAAVHNLLERLTGGKVTINSIKPNYEHVQRPATNTEKYEYNIRVPHNNIFSVFTLLILNPLIDITSLYHYYCLCLEIL